MKNRQHFDLPTASHEGEVDRPISLGASVVRDDDEPAVMADLEGNEFCVE